MTSTLVAPMNVTAADSSTGRVAVHWSASAGSLTPQGYYVTRITGSTTTPACGSSVSSLITASSCMDTGLSDGDYTYVVTSVYRTWTARSVVSGNVTVSMPKQLLFGTQPATSIAGSAIAPAVKVALTSADGTPVHAADIPVTVAVGSGPASSALTGTVVVTTNSSGVAVFDNLVLNVAGAGYTLTAKSEGLPAVTSTTFAVTSAAATVLVVTSAAISGSASATATAGPVTVALKDTFGNAAVAPAGGITLSMSSNTVGAAVFSGTSAGAETTSVNIAAGSSAAAFYYGDTKAGSPTIAVSSPGLASAAQTETITAAPAAKLVFVQQPSTTPRGSTITPPITAEIQDVFGNHTDSTAAVTIAIGTNAGLLGLGGGVLQGTTTRTASGGAVIFDDLSIHGIIPLLGLTEVGGTGNGYTLQATSAGLTSVTSDPFNITAAL